MCVNLCWSANNFFLAFITPQIYYPPVVTSYQSLRKESILGATQVYSNRNYGMQHGKCEVRWKFISSIGLRFLLLIYSYIVLCSSSISSLCSSVIPNVSLLCHHLDFVHLLFPQPQLFSVFLYWNEEQLRHIFMGT